MSKSEETSPSIRFDNKKLTYEQIEFAYQSALDTATKQLFEDFYDQHGWTKEEFLKASVLYANAIADGRLVQWLN